MVPHRLVVLFGRLLESSVWDSSSVVSTNAQAATLLLLQISRFFMEPIHFSLTSKTLNFDFQTQDHSRTFKVHENSGVN